MVHEVAGLLTCYFHEWADTWSALAGDGLREGSAWVHCSCVRSCVRRSAEQVALSVVGLSISGSGGRNRTSEMPHDGAGTLLLKLPLGVPTSSLQSLIGSSSVWKAFRFASVANSNSACANCPASVPKVRHGLSTQSACLAGSLASHSLSCRQEDSRDG